MTRRAAFSTILVVVLLTGLCFQAFAAETGNVTVTIAITDVLAIAVSGNQSFTVAAAAPAAGAWPPIVDLVNTPSHLQYTSVMAAPGDTCKITVEVAALSAVPIPLGLKLNVRAGTPTGNGGVGTPVAGGVILDNANGAAVPIVTGIASCATGAGGSQGAPVYYTLAIDEATFKDLDATAAGVVTLTYTIVLE
jgi:hypothetical protein